MRFILDRIVLLILIPALLIMAGVKELIPNKELDCED